MTQLKPLQQLRDLDTSSPQFHKRLGSYLRGNQYRSAVSSLQGEDLSWLVEYLNGVLVGIPDHTSLAFQECLRELRYICGIKEVLPKSCALPGLLLDNSLPSAPRRIYEGTFGGSRVRIQRVRIYPGGDPQKINETFHQAIVVWKHLAHQNIVPLLGVTVDPPQIALGWMYGGDLTEYITNNPDADRLSLLSGIAEGLSYLHSCNVIHGDLKGQNVLVDTIGCARITNFGFATVTQNLGSLQGTSTEPDHSVRWIAPEILDGRGMYSKEADIFSFAMVVIEVFTCAVPFSESPPREAMLAIVGGKRPPRPTDPTLTERLWELTKRCWDKEACRRPRTLQIVCGFGIPAWKRLIDRPFTTDERISLITAIFSDRGEIEAVKRLCGDHAQPFVDVIDETLDRLPPRLQKKCLNTLCRICGRQALLPRSVQIPLCYDRSDTPLYRGGYADVWKGEHQGRKVAVKVLVVYLTSDLGKITRMFCKEVMTWKTLRHQNVLPLLGVTMSTNQFVMASEWMDNGNINEFIKTHKDVNRFELLKDVSRGLAYMHGEGVVHGDLKGANILIDQDCHARLADFGLTAIVSDSTYHTTTTSSPNGGTTRWMSPERLNPNQFGLKDSRPTKESDCYALGMVILEVLSGQAPFRGDCNDFIVMQKVLDGKHPERPRGAEQVWFTDDLWGMLEQCWSSQTKDRPIAGDILEHLERVWIVWKPLPLSVDSGVEADSDGETDTDNESLLTASGPVSPTAGSHTRGSSDIITPESTDESRVSSPIQPSETTNLKESARTINETPPTQFVGRLHSSDPLPTRGLLRDAIDGDSAEPNDPNPGNDRGATLPELTVQLSADSPAGSNDGLTTDGTGSKSHFVANAPHHSRRNSSDTAFTPVRHKDAAGTREDVGNSPAPLVKHELIKDATRGRMAYLENQRSETTVPTDIDSLSTAAANRNEGSLPGTDQVLTTFTTLPNRVGQSTPSLRLKTTPTGAKSEVVFDLAALTALLDGLCTDQSSEDLSKTLEIAFVERKLYKLYRSFLVKDKKRAKALLEVFDKALVAPEHDAKIFKEFRHLCGETGLLPTSHVIAESSIKTTERPVASGGFCDMWKGIHNDERVAIKSIRVHKHDDIKRAAKVADYHHKIFCKEVVMWRRISHPNIVPFLGVSTTPVPLSMVSEWMPNGNVRDYVGENPDTSRLQLLLEVCRGLSFLHSLEIVHGDLKGDNILVDKSGCARLSDFGLAGIAGLNYMETSAAGFKGSHRWMAPELIKTDDDGKSGLLTNGSDVFALGMVTFEIFTGQVPFAEDEASAAVMKKIIGGERPPRPPKGKELGLSDEFWEIIQSSLTHKKKKRPPVETFVTFLEKATPDVAVLKELIEFDANSEGDIQKLRKFFEKGNNTLFGMREDEILVAIEVFDRVLNSSLNDCGLRSRCLRGLQKVSARCGLLPKSYWISHNSLARPDGAFSVTGRVSNTCLRSINGQLVAVKTIDPDCINGFNGFKHRLYINAVMWKRLRHPNVVSFLGFDSDYTPFSLVYAWMPNGCLSSWLRDHPHVDKLGLLLDVARGLTYLHQYNLVHGNLTGHNVLVDSDGYACISDYGLEAVLRDEGYTKLIPTNARWVAPEVLCTKNRRVPSGDDGKAADVYSFAIVMFEILTESTPFLDESDEAIADRVTTGLRPNWPSTNPPQGLTGAVWGQIEACWNQEPKERPAVSNVLETLVALDEAQHRELVVSVGDPDSKAPVSSLSGFKAQYRNGNDIYWSGGYRHPFGKHVGRLYISREVMTDPTGRHESVEKPDPGTEIIDQREESITVSCGRVAYLVSLPIPEGKTLRNVVITIVSKDQGWSNYQEDHGTYRNSWTWFELSVGPSKDSERWRGEVVRNLHAYDGFKEHTVEISDRDLYEKAKSGDVLTVWALSWGSGWRNRVKKVTTRYVVE